MTDDSAARKSAYRVGDAFADALIRGAASIARQGAGRCLVDGCDAQAAPPAIYCWRHDNRNGNLPGGADSPQHASRMREVRRVFDLAGPTILAGPRLPFDVERALVMRQHASARRAT